MARRPGVPPIRETDFIIIRMESYGSYHKREKRSEKERERERKELYGVVYSVKHLPHNNCIHGMPCKPSIRIILDLV